MNVLPDIEVFSPSDWVLARAFADHSIKVKKPKYIRLDGKPLPQIYRSANDFKIKDGFCELRKGRRLCIVSTGIMTHKALLAADQLSQDSCNIGVIDVFMMKPLNEKSLLKALGKYQAVITLEEGFINKGGLDSLVLQLISRKNKNIRFKNMGFGQKYVFDIGARDHLHKLNGLDNNSIIKNIKALLKGT
jgi:transketolase